MNFDELTKMERSQWITYLDTKPTGSTPEFNILGIGITDMSIAYNPSVDSEKWVIENTARHVHSSNEKQMAVSQSIYLGDPCYEFVRDGKGKLNYKTHILDIDMTRKDTSGKYYAELSDGLITVTNWMGESAVLEYDLYYEGEPTIGAVIIENGVPTFEASAEAISLSTMKSASVDKSISTTSTKKTSSNEVF